MGKPTSNIGAVLRADCEKRIDLEIRLHKVAGDILKDIDAVDVLLKDHATVLGSSTKEAFAGRGTVSVSGRKPQECEGEGPVADPVAFKALTDKERRDLIKRGVIKLEPILTRASYGRVQVKIF